jgi:hypothetical protein
MLPRPPKTPLIEEYQRYRKAAKGLNTKIVQTFVDEGVINEASRALDLGRDRILVLDTEDDLSIMMEYALYEVQRQGMSLVTRYRQEIGGSGAMEQELLAAMDGAQTGLYRVEQTLPQEGQSLLRDLAGTGTTIALTDIGFSQTMISGVIMFFRPIVMPNFTMTSGVTFVFPPEMELALRGRWRREWVHARPSRRFADLFKLNKRKGITTKYV